jgi:TadE-like protein
VTPEIESQILRITPRESRKAMEASTTTSRKLTSFSCRMRGMGARLAAWLDKRSPYDGEAGVALVEFALVLPLLLILLLGMLDLGRAFNYWNDETQLSHEASRWAAVNKNPGPGATLQESIRRHAETAELRDGGSSSLKDPLQVCISFPGGSSNVGDPVQVTVRTTYTFLSFIGDKVGVQSKDVRGTSTMRLESQPTNYAAGCA